MATKLKVAVLVSGGGSNLQALMDACALPAYPAEIVLVIANRSDAFGLQRAQNAGIATQLIEHQKFADRDQFDAALHAALLESGADAVCLAGFMRLLTPPFVQAWQGRMLNIHPSLLPSFKGLHTHQRAIDAGVRFTGCTVHFVVPEMDEGPIIIQAAVPVQPDDSQQSLNARVLACEHQIYPTALRWLAEGRLAIENGRVLVNGARLDMNSLIWPVVD